MERMKVADVSSDHAVASLEVGAVVIRMESVCMMVERVHGTIAIGIQLNILSNGRKVYFAFFFILFFKDGVEMIFSTSNDFLQYPIYLYVFNCTRTGYTLLV